MILSTFNGAALRLARAFQGRTLEELAERAGKTRQFLHKIETGQAVPGTELVELLAAIVHVEPRFFYDPASSPIAEEEFHFRRLFTSRMPVKQLAMAKAEVFVRLVAVLEKRLKMPALNIPTVDDVATADDIEKAAELCREHWGLGNGPISNMMRLAENQGAIITMFHSISKEVDALSVFRGRPVIVRNDAKESTCRLRFDIAHELGHAVLHRGVPTGDRFTESQAHRFAGALLIPRAMMTKLFPRMRGSHIDWRALSQFKLTWKLSKAAIIYRARELDLITEQQFRSGVITLKRCGEAISEREDSSIPREEPELLKQAIAVLESQGITIASVASELHVRPEFLEEFVGNLGYMAPTRTAEIIQFSQLRKIAG